MNRFRWATVSLLTFVPGMAFAEGISTSGHELSTRTQTLHERPALDEALSERTASLLEQDPLVYIAHLRNEATLTEKDDPTGARALTAQTVLGIIANPQTSVGATLEGAIGADKAALFQTAALSMHELARGDLRLREELSEIRSDPRFSRTALEFVAERLRRGAFDGSLRTSLPLLDMIVPETVDAMTRLKLMGGSFRYESSERSMLTPAQLAVHADVTVSVARDFLERNDHVFTPVSDSDQSVYRIRDDVKDAYATTLAALSEKVHGRKDPDWEQQVVLFHLLVADIEEGITDLEKGEIRELMKVREELAGIVLWTQDLERNFEWLISNRKSIDRADFDRYRDAQRRIANLQAASR